MQYDLNTSKLKRIRVEVDSSVIDALDYSLIDLELIVSFKKQGMFKKKTRKYSEVSPGQFFNLLSADSIGRSLKYVKESPSVLLKRQEV